MFAGEGVGEGDSGSADSCGSADGEEEADAVGDGDAAAPGPRGVAQETKQTRLTVRTAAKAIVRMLVRAGGIMPPG